MTTEQTSVATAFAAEFPATEEQWLKTAEAALKGRPLEPILHAKTIDGVGFDAIAKRREPKPIAGRAAGAPWTAMTRIDIADPEAANAQALEDLTNGATGLSLVFADAEGRGGLVADTLDRLDKTLDGVFLDLAPIHLDARPWQGGSTAALVAALIERRKQDPADISVLFGLDLLRDLSRAGSAPAPLDRLARRSASVVKSLFGRGFKSPVLMIDQRPSHEAGASEAQELAGALAGAVEHIRLLSAHGLGADAIADTTAFAFAADADQFATIAKLRAARLLWAAVRRELGVGDKPAHIHAETSRRMLSRKDAHTNMVRTTIAAFAAGVGGADSVVALPFTAAIGVADWDARRIARNAQSIVLEETNAYRVADPAAGAGAIERLTDQLAEKAWEIFREIERDGGMRKALASGAWQERLNQTRAARDKAVAARKIAIVGVSEFPKADEAAITTPTEQAQAIARGVKVAALGDDGESDFAAVVTAFANGASFADIDAAWTQGDGETIEPLALVRNAAAFEELRAQNESRSQQPRVFLALLGPVARHSARAGFIRNLLAAGGIAPVEGPVAAAPDAIAEAFKTSGCGLALVCGADGDYAEGGSDVVNALKASGAAVWLAGRPKDGRSELETAGVERFVAAGDDAIAILADASATQGGA